MSSSEAAPQTASAPDVARTRQSLNGTWTGTPVQAAAFDELNAAVRTADARPIRIPFLSAHPRHNAWRLEREFVHSAPHDGPATVCRLRLHAAMLGVRVRLNGTFVGEHRGGYTPFELPLDHALTPGTNRLAIDLLGEQAAFDGLRVLHHPVSISTATLSGRHLHQWREQTGLEQPSYRVGLWQDVELVRRPAVAIRRLKITPQPTHRRLELSWEMEGAWCPDETDRWTWSIHPAGSAKVLVRGAATLVQLRQNGSRLGVTLPDLPLQPWTPDTPVLYELALTYHGAGFPADAVCERFGYRDFRVEGGDFLLNGRPIVLRGESCLLQNRGLQFHNPLALENPLFWNRDYCRQYMRRLKQAFDINFLRVHGSIGHPAIFEAADEVGLLLEAQSSVWSRGFGFYKASGAPFLEACAREFGAWIRRDWNHPSIVIWGADNEMGRIASNDEDASFFATLSRYVRELDPSRPVVSGGSAGTYADTDFYHIHHEEDYAFLLREWRRNKPLVFGEFWVGGRGAEQRLTNGDEYLSLDDYRRKHLRLWAQKIEPMRAAGASGVQPYNFTAHWLQSWAGLANGYAEPALAPLREGVMLHPPEDATAAAVMETRPGQSAVWSHLLGRYHLAAASPQRSFAADRDSPLLLTVRNDHDAPIRGRVRLALEGKVDALAESHVDIAPHTSRTIALTIPANTLTISGSRLQWQWLDESGRVLDQGADSFYGLEPPAASGGRLRFAGLRIHAVRSGPADAVANFFRAQGIETVGHAPGEVPWDELTGGILLVDGATLASLEDWPQQVNHRGIHLLVLDAAAYPHPYFGAIQTLSFHESLPYARQFDSILQRGARFSDISLPVEGVWETDLHPLRQGLPDRYWRRDDLLGAVADGVLLHPGTRRHSPFGAANQVGAAMECESPTGAHTNGAPGPSPGASRFRSLISGPRREYAILGEVHAGPCRHLLCCLRLPTSLADHPAVARLLVNAVTYLAAHARGDMEVPHAAPHHVEVIHNVAALGEAAPAVLEALGARLEIVPADGRANHLAFDLRGVFSGTKCEALLTRPVAAKHLFHPAPGRETTGGWAVLAVNRCFEVFGDFFPWEYQTTHPRQLGYRAVALPEGDGLRVYLMDPWPDAAALQDPVLGLLAWQLDDLRRGQVEVAFIDAAASPPASRSPLLTSHASRL